MKTAPSLQLSPICAGMMRWHDWGFSSIDDARQWVEQCLELGITSFDHADIYGSYTIEEAFGKVLAQAPHLRETMQIVTKCSIALLSENRPQHRVKHYNTSPAHIRDSVQRSLKNLQCETIDLLLLHRPDPLMDAHEAAAALTGLIQSGDVQQVGVSNFNPSQTRLLQNALDVPLVTNQIECSLIHTDPLFDGTLDEEQMAGRTPMIWSPFGGGTLFDEESSDERVHRLRTLLFELAETYRCSIDQLMIAWLRRLPTRPVIITGTGKAERLKKAVDALSVELDRQDWFRLLEASHGHRVA
ncbi:MAG: aldo/keto reductase [Balneolaceae bacterium]